VAVMSQALAQGGSQVGALPPETLLVRGAWSSASDPVTPVPEAGTVASLAYVNEYFGLTYPLPAHWTQKYEGPPPSDSGYYVLAQILPPESPAGGLLGSVLIVAHDLFFMPVPAADALQFVNDTSEHLTADYRVEQPPTRVRIHDRSFVRFGYVAPATGLHWYILATEVRCHVVQFIFTSRDTALIRSLVRDFNNVRFRGGDAPLCVNDYANDANVIERVEPVLFEHRFHPIPVRVVIGKDGKVEHIHFLSAFPSEAQSITAALRQWRFRPYLSDGQPVAVETGILFGRAATSEPLGDLR
jgi:Gram-negative bacterial TonB protein C-terminal